MQSPSRFFPPVETTDPDGFLCIGGQITPEWLLDAYRRGIFPWPFRDDEFTAGQDVLAWWSPNPRSIIELDQFHVPRRLARTLQSGQFDVTCNESFHEVMLGCATAQKRAGETWITPEMVDAYCELHEIGYAHSVETRQDGNLVGGVYGVAIGGMFAAESKFYRVRDASKVALVRLLQHVQKRGFTLFDVQQQTAHAARFGAVEVDRKEFLDRLDQALALPVTFGDALEVAD
jgi:leucyl/phenylalanyl-tRNA--protein transferase